MCLPGYFPSFGKSSLMGSPTLESSVNAGLEKLAHFSRFVLSLHRRRHFLATMVNILTSMVPEPSTSNESNTSWALARRRFSGDAPRMRILARTAAAFVRLVSWASSAFPASVCERSRHRFGGTVYMLVSFFVRWEGWTRQGRARAPAAPAGVLLPYRTVPYHTPFLQQFPRRAGHSLRCPWYLRQRSPLTNIFEGYQNRFTDFLSLSFRFLPIPVPIPRSPP